MSPMLRCFAHGSQLHVMSELFNSMCVMREECHPTVTTEVVAMRNVALAAAAA